MVPAGGRARVRQHKDVSTQAILQLRAMHGSLLKIACVSRKKERTVDVTEPAPSGMAADIALSPVIEAGEAGESEAEEDAASPRTVGSPAASPPSAGGARAVKGVRDPESLNRRRIKRDYSGKREAPVKKQTQASPYGEISSAMARVDALGKQGGVGIGFQANLLRGELIEKRLEEKKKSSDVKAAKARATAKRRAQKSRPAEDQEVSRAIDEAWEAPTEVIASARHYRPPRPSALQQPPWDPSAGAMDDVAEEEEVLAATRIQAIQRGRVSRRKRKEEGGVEDAVARELVQALTSELMLAWVHQPSGEMEHEGGRLSTVKSGGGGGSASGPKGQVQSSAYTTFPACPGACLWTLVHFSDK